MNKKIVFVDIDLFPHEKYTSGLFIIVREILKYLNTHGYESIILSVAKCNEQNPLPGRTEYKDGEIRVIQYFRDHSILFDNLDNTANVFKKELSIEAPDIIFSYPPAVFFSQIHIDILEIARACCSKCIIAFFDSLYPTPGKFDSNLVKKYYRLLNEMNVYAVSEKYIDNLAATCNIQVKKFPQLLRLNEVVQKIDNKVQFITLVNTHPIKGRQIFNKIAELLPEKQFQIVESWPDVPPYFPPTKNITFSQFYSNPSELYSSIEILLVPSLWEEGVPCVISEALFNKIPVIAHDIGGIKEAGSEYILYVNPPTIHGHFLKETIIYPQIESAEETRVAKDFCEKILWIDTHPQEKQRLADGGYDFTKSLENNARKEILRIFN